MKFAAAVSIAGLLYACLRDPTLLIPLRATVAALPFPGGPHGGTPAACHEAKALQLQKAGNRAAASKEKSLAAAARKKHFSQGNHKRSEPAMCHEAAAVQMQNHGNRRGAAAERAKENKSELKMESAVADKASGKSSKKGSSKAKHH
jgi:hypothetical protein